MSDSMAHPSLENIEYQGDASQRSVVSLLAPEMSGSPLFGQSSFRHAVLHVNACVSREDIRHMSI